MPATGEAAPLADVAPHSARFALLSSTATTLRLWLWAAAAGVAAASATMGLRWLAQQVEWLATRQHGALVRRRAFSRPGSGLLVGVPSAFVPEV